MQETQEMQICSLGQEDPLEKEMATHFSILARWILWTEESGGLQSMGSQRIRYDWMIEHMFALSYSEHVLFICLVWDRLHCAKIQETAFFFPFFFFFLVPSHAFLTRLLLKSAFPSILLWPQSYWKEANQHFRDMGHRKKGAGDATVRLFSCPANLLNQMTVILKDP